MSKLVEMLDRTTEAKTQPLGFGATLKGAGAAPLVLLARLPKVEAAAVRRALEAGADALLLEGAELGEGSQALAQATSGAGEVPWGVWMGSVQGEEVGRLAEMGCDFIVFGAPNTPAAVLAEEGVGKVLATETSLSDGLARAVSRLAVDAIMLAEGGDSPLTVQRMMLYERLSGYTGKHLIAPLPASAEPDDLDMLWEAGVRGVVVDMAAEEAGELLGRAKGWIEEITPRKPKAREKMDAILPLAGGLAEEEPFPEEEF